MIYQQDWLMRQIEAMIQAVLAVALGISANEQTATQIEDSSYGKMLEKMIDDGDICAAEDLLFNDLDQSDLSWLQIALDFYSKLNLHARTLGTTINETVQTAGVESILAIIYTVANGKDRVYFGPAAR